MILYKYCPPDRVDILAAGLVGLTRPRFFNDPFELSPHISGVISGIDMARVTWEHTKDCVVLSLSEVADHPLMWGHYAASLTGFVIGFDADQEILAHPSPHRKLQRIAYSKIRPSRPRFEDFTDEEIFFTKADVWAYEREWRLLDRRDSATCGPPSKSAYDTWMFRINPRSVVEVICGWRGSQARETIQNILRRTEFENVVLKNAQPDQRVYEIRLYELPRSDWDYWYLDTLPGAPAPSPPNHANR